MLTSFLEKSRPINFLILGSFIFIGYVFSVVLHTDASLGIGSLPFHLILIFISVLSLYVLNFIVEKNSLTLPNTFAVFFYTGFLLLLPVIFSHADILAANLFLLLAIRRIVSLEKNTKTPQKILDASLWITIASLFYFWCLLLFIPLWIAIVLKPNADYKQMLMPLVGFVTIFLIVTAYQLGVNHSLAWFLDWSKPIATDFSAYNKPEILWPITMLIVIFIWTGISRLATMKTLSLKDRPKQFLLFHITVITLLIALGAPEKTGAEFLFTMAPIAVIAANYFERDNKKQRGQSDKLEFWFKEILLLAIAGSALFFLFL